MNDLEKFFLEHKGGKIHKWMHYFEIYDRHFARFRGTDVHVVEIGVAHGGSLQMWKQYFGPKAHIYGVDVEPTVKKLEEPQVKIFVGDQSNAAFLESLVAEIPRIDILIDDGGHTMLQQEVTFRTLFPHVNPGGVYLCEDLHTSYWGHFGGGYKREGTFIEISKGLVDELNSWHSHTPKLAVTDFTRSAHSIHFYDSVVVIEKRQMQSPSHETRGVDTIDYQQEPARWPLNSVQLRPGLAKRIARRVPGYGLVTRTVSRRWSAWK